jgi:hypothetical protein
VSEPVVRTFEESVCEAVEGLRPVGIDVALPDAGETLDDGPAVRVRPIRFEVSLLPEDDVNYRLYAVKVEYFGEGKWAVHDGFGCLGVDGTWDEGLHAYGRGDEWLAAHRFDKQTAIKLAREAAPGVTVHGITAAQALARREKTREAS